MADLLALGYGEADEYAYAIAFSENTVWNVKRKQAHRASVMNSNKFQEVLIARKKSQKLHTTKMAALNSSERKKRQGRF